MRIAQVAPLVEAVPPRHYGGTERVIAWLTDALVKRGHEVTLFASADSRTRATLAPGAPPAARTVVATQALDAMLDRVRARQSEFDVLHFHTDRAHFGRFADLARKCVTTLHLRLDDAAYGALFARHPEMTLVAISESQRKPWPGAAWAATVPHGLPADTIRFGRGEGGFLAFLGRISPDKRPDRAIAIARRSGTPLRIAAKVDAADQDYFDDVIRPLLADPLIEFLGEVDDRGKAELLASARALLFPIDWPEPFGLVMIEAMAAGTPVIAWPNGAVPEVVDDGVTGRIVATIDAAVAAVETIATLPRSGVRARFLASFTAGHMAAAYERVYAGLASR